VSPTVSGAVPKPGRRGLSAAGAGKQLEDGAEKQLEDTLTEASAENEKKREIRNPNRPLASSRASKGT